MPPKKLLKPIVIALDFSNSNEALTLVDKLDPDKCRLKVGKELFVAAGPELVKAVVARGFDVFLDLKFHDIPNTVAAAIKASSQLGVWMMNVHASGGPAMMEAAVHALDSEFSGFASSNQGADKDLIKPLLIAVTVLTSLSKEDLQLVGIDSTPFDQVISLAQLSQQSGMDGVVCSAAETAPLREHLGKSFALVTPGIRRPQDSSADQKRVVGPAEAMACGSDYLVIGRPITKAVDPLLALEQFNALVKV